MGLDFIRSVVVWGLCSHSNRVYWLQNRNILECSLCQLTYAHVASSDHWNILVVCS